jgi:hypothetical protein
MSASANERAITRIPAGCDPNAIRGIPEEAAFVGPGTKSEAVSVSVFTREAPLVTLKEKREIEAGMRRAARKQFDRILEGPARTDGNGVTGFFIVVTGRNPEGIKFISQQALIIFGLREYLLQCQFAPARADDMDAGCRQALDTLKIDGLVSIDQ